MKVKIVSSVKASLVAIRLFNGKNKKVFYGSSRIGGIKQVTDGYELDIPKVPTGSSFEIKDLDKRKVILTGTITLDKKKNMKAVPKEVSTETETKEN